MKLFDDLYKDIQVDLFKHLDGTENAVIKSYQVAMESIHQDLAELYKKYSEDGKLYWTEMNRYGRLKKLETEIGKQLAAQLSEVNQFMEKETVTLFQETFYRHAWAIDQDAGYAYSWGGLPKDAIESVIHSPLSKFADSKALANAVQGTVDQVRNEITLSLVRGEAYSKMAARIGHVLGFTKTGKFRDGGAAYRSLMVARTEGQRVLVEGQQRAYDKAKELGIDLVELWDATLDLKTRARHGSMDGKKRGEDGLFDTGYSDIGKVQGPLQSGVASFDIHCRCRVRAQIPGYPPEKRYVRGNGGIPWVSYKDWKAGLKSGKYNPPDQAERDEAKKKTREKIEKAFSIDTIPKDAKAVYAKYKDSIPIITQSKKGIYYSPTSNSITFSTQRLDDYVIRHEYGHAFDFHGTQSAESSKMDFINEAQKARRSISKSNPEKRKAVIDYIHAHMEDPPLSDLICSLTGGEISGRWGHSPGYYRDYSWRTVEMFANMFDLYCRQDSHWNWIEKNFTDLTSKFRLIIKELS